MSRLEVVSPSSLRGECRDLWGGTVLLGRGKDADWRLVEPTVSRRHAVIRHFADHDEIEDVGSMSGTRVNGRPIDGPVVLRPGDVVDVAGVRLRYTSDEPDAEPVTEADAADDGLLASLGDASEEQVEPEASAAGVVARVLMGLGGVVAGAGAVLFLVALAVAMAGGGDAGVATFEVGGVSAVPASLGLALGGLVLFVGGLAVQKSPMGRSRRR